MATKRELDLERELDELRKALLPMPGCLTVRMSLGDLTNVTHFARHIMDVSVMPEYAIAERIIASVRDIRAALLIKSQRKGIE